MCVRAICRTHCWSSCVTRWCRQDGREKVSWSAASPETWDRRRSTKRRSEHKADGVDSGMWSEAWIKEGGKSAVSRGVCTKSSVWAKWRNHKSRTSLWRMLVKSDSVLTYEYEEGMKTRFENRKEVIRMNAHRNVDCRSFRMKAGLQTNVVKGEVPAFNF